jgi:hypothetical protein
MPLIGEVDKYMAGGTAVTALYAGAVKAWPLVPAADYTTVWTQNPSGALVLTVQSDGTNAPTSGTKTFYVPPFTETLTHPEYRLGVPQTSGLAQIIWHRTDIATNDVTVFIGTAAYHGVPVTNSVAVSDFAGHVLRFTFTFGPQINSIEAVA